MDELDIDDILSLDEEDDFESVPSVEDILGVEAESHVKGRRPPSLRQRMWLAHYMDAGNAATFSNATESARKAGYLKDPSDAGKYNLRKFRDAFNCYFENQGVGRRRVFEKLHELMSATETKFFAHEGFVNETRVVKALNIQLGAARALSELLGMKIERRIIEGGDTPIKHTLTVPPEVRAKLDEIYGG